MSRPRWSGVGDGRVDARDRKRRKRVYTFRPFVVIGVKVGDFRPRPRSGHRIACSQTALYSLGGYNPDPPSDHVSHPATLDDGDPQPAWTPDRPIFRELWKLNLATQSWRRLPGDDTLPEQLASSALCLAGRTLMVFGGTGVPFGSQCSNSLHVYDVTGEATDGFRLIETRGRPPLPQYGQSIVYDDGSLYVVGGTDGLLYTVDVHRLDLRTFTWETVFTCNGNRANEPAARYRHELAFEGGKLYVLAGGTAERAFDFVDVPAFDLRTRTWSFRKSAPDRLGRGRPAARKCHSAVQIDNGYGVDVFVMGGFDNDTIFDDLWKLEVPSLQWTLMRKSSFPYPLYFHSSAVTPEGCMYTFGGIQSNREGRSTSRSDRLYKLWLRIPKLSEICWESMLFYFPHIINVESAKLLKLGVPSRFVERLEN